MRQALKFSTLLIAIWAVIIGGGCASQRTFQTPELAATALRSAVTRQERNELRRIFGPRADELKTGDADVDREDFIILARKLDAGHSFEEVPPDHATLLVGEDQWPFAVPLVKTDDAWRFDTDAGIEEAISRRIGLNELLTIAACHTLVDAQAEFFERDPDGVGVKHYAQHLMSTEGTKDGLYWPVSGNEDPSPIGPVLAQAATRTDDRGDRIPYNGYRYKLLTRQGPGARGGEMDYVTDGRLTKGWATLAYPAEYGTSGVMTFLVSHDGVVFEQDLGPETGDVAVAITAFDPDPDWTDLN